MRSGGISANTKYQINKMTTKQKIQFIQSKQNIKNNTQSFSFHPSNYTKQEIDQIYQNLKNPKHITNNPKVQ